MDTTTVPADLAYDALGARSPDPSLLSAEELATAVRRLRLRLDGLRKQHAQRLTEMHLVRLELGQVREEAAASARTAELMVAQWRERALQAEAAHQALLESRTLRALRGPRELYSRLRRLLQRHG